MNSIEKDAELINTLGGPPRVAELLGFEKHGGVQRVQNWTVRGIPANIKVQFPAIFMPELAQAAAHQPQPATASVAQEV